MVLGIFLGCTFTLAVVFIMSNFLSSHKSYTEEDYINDLRTLKSEVKYYKDKKFLEEKIPWLMDNIKPNTPEYDELQLIIKNEKAINKIRPLAESYFDKVRVRVENYQRDKV